MQRHRSPCAREGAWRIMQDSSTRSLKRFRPKIIRDWEGNPTLFGGPRDPISRLAFLDARVQDLLQTVRETEKPRTTSAMKTPGGPKYPTSREGGRSEERRVGKECRSRW